MFQGMGGRLFLEVQYNMYTEISNPMDYKAAFYIRLSKEDGNAGESESITNVMLFLGSHLSKPTYLK